MNDDMEAIDRLCAKIIEQRDRIVELEAQLRADTDLFKRTHARIEALEAALRGLVDAVRTDVEAGYGWGAWLPDEYAGAERALKMVADRVRAALAPEQEK